MNNKIAMITGIIITACVLSYFRSKEEEKRKAVEEKLIDETINLVKECMPKPEFKVNLSSSHFS